VTTKHHPTPEERDERVSVPLPPEEAIAAFLAVDPSSEPQEVCLHCGGPISDDEDGSFPTENGVLLALHERCRSALIDALPTVEAPEAGTDTDLDSEPPEDR
jgi:hypothetical protein